MASGGSGVKSDAFAGMGQAQAQQGQAYNVLAPQYAALASGNMGLTPQQKADALTASGQALGGSTAGIVGQGALESARTGNAGSYSAVADAAAHNAMGQQSANALGVQNQSDEIARQNQQIGLQGEQNLFNTSGQEATSYLNIANQAKPSFFQQYLQGVLQRASNPATYAEG